MGVGNRERDLDDRRDRKLPTILERNPPYVTNERTPEIDTFVTRLYLSSDLVAYTALITLRDRSSSLRLRKLIN